MRGWRAGLSGGLTRRANSVLPLARSDDDADLRSRLDDVEALYAAHGLPPVVRVCAAAGDGRRLDDELERRGYTVAARTLVLARDAPTAAPSDAAPVAGTLARAAVAGGGAAEPVVDAGPVVDAAPDGFAVVEAAEPDDPWLRRWLGVKTIARAAGDPGHPDLGAARRLVTAVPARYLAATAADPGAADPGAPSRPRDADRGAPSGRRDGAHDAVVRVAVHAGWAAVSCLAVGPHARGRGLGAALTVAATRTGALLGAGRTFLQVEAGNATALRLYARLGFVVVDEYHYRERPDRRPAGAA